MDLCDQDDVWAGRGNTWSTIGWKVNHDNVHVAVILWLHNVVDHATRPIDEACFCPQVCGQHHFGPDCKELRSIIRETVVVVVLVWVDCSRGVVGGSDTYDWRELA